MKSKIFFAIMTLIHTIAFTQNVNNIQMPELLNENVRKIISVPDILGYKTLKCDFHMHTVFSDGSVWPTIRVDEAWNEGLNAIAITDHIENNPSKKFVGGDDNSSYEIALPQAKQKNIILIKGGEITRSMPPGHFNALFLEDTQALNTENWQDAFSAAKEQGAYFIWNHPGWKTQQPDTCKWWDEHTDLYNKGMLHAIEVFNEKEWYPIALDWCMEKDIAPHASSDIHGINSEFYNLRQYHRPMTLVLATERTEDAIREALFANRTIAWFGHYLAGKEEYLKAFFYASVKICSTGESQNGKSYSVKNFSDVPFYLEDENGREFFIPAMGENIITNFSKTGKYYKVRNLFIKGHENLKIEIS
jgi:3',5'-nucleoside bisphosphate phosphatase